MLFPILACVFHGGRVAGASALARGARVRVGVMRGPPSCALSTGSGRTDLGGAPTTGSGGCDGGRRRPAPRPCTGFPRERERRWGVWWDALARGVRVRVGGPWPALAGGRFANRPYDRGVCGVAGMRGGPLRVPSGQAQGERIWEGRLQRGVRDAMGDGGAPRRAPALGSRESGNDDGGCGEIRWREGLVSRVGARSRGRAVREPPLRPGWGARGRG